MAEVPTVTRSQDGPLVSGRSFRSMSDLVTRDKFLSYSPTDCAIASPQVNLETVI